MNAFKFLRKKQPANKSPASLKSVVTFNRFIITFFVLLTSLATTYFIWNAANATREKELHSYFEFRAREINTRIEQRIISYEQVLRSMRSLYVASDNINRKEFSSFFNSLNLNKNYPGIQGVGFSLIIPPALLKEHINGIRKEGFSEYKIWPEGKRETYTSIIYLEPFRDLNLRAFGYDMFSEPVRRKAMETARDSNKAAISGKVLLVQETGKAVQAGFLIYLPIYKNGAPHSSVNERRASITGWVYSPFRMNDFMEGSLGEHAADLDVEIYDTKNIRNETKMYDSNTDTNMKVQQLVMMREINFDDHEWTVLVKSTPQLESRIGVSSANIILIVAISISLLLAIISWLMLNNRKNIIIANTKRESMLAQLTEEINLRRILFEQSPDGIVVIDPHTARFIEFNTAAHRQLGYSRDEFAKLCIADMEAEETQEETDSKMRRVLNERRVDFETLQHTKDGEIRNVFVIAQYIDNSKHPVYHCLWRDITERKQAEAVLSESERRTRALLNANPDMIFRMNRDGTYLDYKADRSDLYAQSEETIIGKKNRDITPPEFADLVDRNIRQTLDSGEMQEFEYQMITPKRGLRNYEARMVASGKDEVITVVRDVTERKLAEENIHKSEYRYRNLFENAGIAIWEEDLSEVRNYINKLKETGIHDFRLYFNKRIDEVIKCASLVKLLDVNKEVLHLVKAKSKKEVIKSLPAFFIEESLDAAREEIIALAEGKMRIEGEMPIKIMDGEIRQILFQLNVVPGFEDTWAKVLFSFIDITERKQSEESLKFFRTLLDKSNDAIEVIDIETGQFIDVNERACTDLGYSRSELLKMFVFDTDPNLNMHDFQLLIQDVRQSNSTIIESIHRRKDGSVFPVEINIAVVKIVKTYSIAIVRDITERKKLETNLSTAAELAKLGYWEFDVKSGNFIFDDQYYRLIHGSSTEIQGGNIMSAEEFVRRFVHPDDSKMISNNLQEAITSTDPEYFGQAETRVFRDNGEIAYVMVQFKVLKDQFGNPLTVYGINQDITERKKAGEALKDSEEQFRSVAQSANDAIITADSEGIIKNWNRGAEKIFGYMEEEIIGKNLDIIIPQGYRENHIDGMRRVQSGGENHVVGNTVELKGLHKSGKEFPLELSLAKWETSKGKFFTGIIRDITERKQVEDSLRLFRTLLDKSNDAIEVVDAETGQFIDVNERACTDLGYSRSELLSMKVFDINPNQTPEEFHSIMVESQLSDSTIIEALHQRKDGSTFPVEVNVTIVKLEKTYTIGIVRDITERKKLETNLSTAAEIAKLGYWEFDVKSGNFILDDQYYRIIHGSSTEKQGGNIMRAEEVLRRLVHPDYSEMIVNKLQEAISSPDPEYIGNTESKVLRDNGDISSVMIQFKVVKDDTGQTIKVVGVVQDITERKQMEEILKNVNARFNLAIEAATISIWEHDFITDIVHVDDNFNQIYGNTQSNYQIEFKDFIKFIHPDDVDIIKINIEESIKSDKKINFEFRIIKPDGDIRNISAYGKIVKDKTNKPIKFIGVNIDISERKIAEAEIKRSNEQLIKLNSEKDKFFSIIAHDLRSPFNGLLNLTELMSDSTENFSPEEFVEYSKSLNEAANNLYKLLENLLEWAQVQKGSITFAPKDIDLSKMVSQSIDTIYQRALQKRIEIINEIDNTQKVYIDEKMISTVFRNLLSNAVKFTRINGKIFIKSNRSNGTIKVSVEDNGVGMDEKDIIRLFKIEEKVSSVGTEGEPSTGLGLLLCKEFIEMHGGKIWTESEKGKGSKFMFTLRKSILSSTLAAV